MGGTGVSPVNGTHALSGLCRRRVSAIPISTTALERRCFLRRHRDDLITPVVQVARDAGCVGTHGNEVAYTVPVALGTSQRTSSRCSAYEDGDDELHLGLDVFDHP